MSSRVENVDSDKPKAKPEVDRFADLLKEQMAPLKVEAAHRAGDLRALEDAIQNFEELEKEKGESQAAKAAKALLSQILGLQKALADACANRNLEKIVQILDFIKKDDYKKSAEGELLPNRPRISAYLKDEMDDAQKLADELKVSKAIPPAILAMDKKTMTEIKSYVKPSPVVHRVMQAAFLLLNEDEEKTSSWTYCQKLCVPDGVYGLNRKMMNFKPDDLDAFIIQRAHHLLKGIDLRTVQKASPGAATFYVWAMSNLPPRNDDQTDNSDDLKATHRADGSKITPETQKTQAQQEQAKKEQAKKEQALRAKSIKTEKEIFKAKIDAQKSKEKPTPKQDYYTILH